VRKAEDFFDFKLSHYRSEEKAGKPIKEDIQRLFKLIEEEGEASVVQRLDLSQFLESEMASESWLDFN